MHTNKCKTKGQPVNWPWWKQVRLACNACNACDPRDVGYVRNVCNACQLNWPCYEQMVAGR